jgi:hypothetical protein
VEREGGNLERLMGEHKRKFGATGNFPEGKLGDDDEGELRFGVAHDDQLVHVDFGKPVKWFAMPPDLALQLASMLTKHAMDIKRGRQ